MQNNGFYSDRDYTIHSLAISIKRTLAEEERKNYTEAEFFVLEHSDQNPIAVARYTLGNVGDNGGT